MPFLSTEMLLEGIANKLGGYTGLAESIRIFFQIDQEPFTYTMHQAVSQCIVDIRVHKRIKTLPEFLNRLVQLERAMPVGDRLGIYLDDIEEYIYQELLRSLDEFRDCSLHIDKSLDQDPRHRARMQQFWQRIEFIRHDFQITVITSLCNNYIKALSVLFWDRPLYIMSVMFENYGVQALNYLIGAIYNKTQMNLLLDQFQDLPSNDEKVSWLLARGDFELSLLSQTLRYAPNRFDEVFEKIELLTPEDKRKLLIHPNDYYSNNNAVILLECAAIYHPEALDKILLHITRLPADQSIDTFLHRMIKKHCDIVRHEIDPESEKESRSLLNAVFAIPDKILLARVLTMQDPSYSRYSRTYKYNLITHLIRNSEPLFIQLLHFVPTIEATDIRNSLMEQIIDEVIDYPRQSRALIRFVLNNTNSQDHWLSLTTTSHWNLLHIAAKDIKLSTSMAQLLLCLDVKQEDDKAVWKPIKENLLAEHNQIRYTPLMLAAQHSPGAIAPLVASILQCENARSILESVNLNGDSALLLAEDSNIQSSIRLIKDALQKTKTSQVPALADNPFSLFASSSENTGDLERAEGEIQIVFQ